MIKIAILGYGTVGSGIYEVLETNKEVITKRVSEEIQVKYILDLRDFPGDKAENLIVHDYDTILNDDEVKIVAEAMGGVEPAYTFAKKALESKKSFCTSNKELVAKHGATLIKIAKENNVNFLFEASVGGGIPIIRSINQSLTPENILEITGILNGTTNYMLTKMANEGVSFDAVLKEAQEKGYAELHPEADIEGHDACRKIAILTSLAVAKQVDFEDIHTEGITKITDVDMVYAKAMNRTIKLFGHSKNEDGKVSAMVAPMLIDDNSPLYEVNDVFNAILVKGNTLDEVMFYGKGAGKLPTASAVVSDIVEEAKSIGKNISYIWSEEKIDLLPFEDIKNRFFVRTSSDNEAKAKEIFKDIDVVKADVVDEFAFITEVMTEKEFKDKSDLLGNVKNTIRVK